MLAKKDVQRGKLEHLFLCLICFSGLFFVASSSLADNACGSEYIDEITSIRYIHDGDTLHLHDGRKIRLTGINTPELARKDNARKISAEPFANAAKKTLKRLFKNDKTISLQYGVEKKDRYGRYLAHGFLANGENIQAVLLHQGLAHAINVPPNTQFSACYLEQERTARCKKKGIWRTDKILQAKNLRNKHTGFHLVAGMVTEIRNNNKGIWLTIDHKLSLGIRGDDRVLFDKKVLHNLLNQRVVVRGWLNKSNRSTPFYMRVKHPLSIQLAKIFSCK